jgi:dTMP kinase
MGIGVGLVFVTGYTLIQENVSDEYRGRTFATLTITSRMTLFLALVAFPVLTTALGNHVVTVGGRALDGKRFALWAGALVVVVAAAGSRGGLMRSRLARPRALSMPFRRKAVRPGGLFIAFEGVEGSGKGTQIRLARAYLESQGRDVIVTREPGGTELGDRLREALLDPATGTLTPRAEALLFAASRAQHVVSVIRPALDEGKIVLCDRFVDSSLAYQGAGRGLGEPDLLSLNAWATEGLFPDLVVLLHVEPEEGLARASEAGRHGPDRIESEEIAFHAKVSDAYLRLADEHPDRIAVVDGRGRPEEVHERVKAAVAKAVTASAEGRAGAT